jgi:hypothetical protein
MFYYARDRRRHENLDVARLPRLSNEYQISECNIVKFQVIDWFYLVLMINVFLNDVHHCRFYYLGIFLEYLYYLYWIKIKKLSMFLPASNTYFGEEYI